MRFLWIKNTHSSQFIKNSVQSIARHGQRLTRLVLFWRHRRSAAPRPNEHRHEPLDKLCIHRIEPPSPKGRCWVAGSIMGHSFSVLVFPEHALHPSYELGRSRISKLDIRREIDDELVVNLTFRGSGLHFLRISGGEQVNRHSVLRVLPGGGEVCDGGATVPASG